MSVPANLENRAAAIGVEFDSGEPERLDRYLSMLLAKNEQFNLTAIRDEATAWERHILDSLTLVSVVSSAQAQRVVDVGSGGGLPGMPLAICVPGVQFTLVESTGKKARFLAEVADALELDNVHVVCERAERFGGIDGEGRGRFDVATARAVGPLSVTLELLTGFVRLHGVVSVIKGAKADEEVIQSRDAMRELRLRHVETIGTPTGRLVVCQKTGATPRRYPRAVGEPKKSPL